LCAGGAGRSGVEKAHIVDGRKHHAILLELLTQEGVESCYIEGEDLKS